MSRKTEAAEKQAETEMPATKALLRTEFAKRLKGLLVKHNISQSEVADRAKIGRDSMSNYVNAKAFPSPTTRARIAKIFGLDPADLMPQLDSAQTAFPDFAMEARGDRMWVRINQMLTIKQAMDISMIINGEATLADLVRTAIAEQIGKKGGK